METIDDGWIDPSNDEGVNEAVDIVQNVHDESIHSDGDTTEDNNFDPIRCDNNGIDTTPEAEDTDVSADDANDDNESGDELTIT